MKKLLLTLSLALMVAVIPLTYAMSWDMPEEPEVHFKASTPKMVQIWNQFTVSLIAVDDRTAYCTCAPPITPLHGANVTTIVTLSDNPEIITELHGKTNAHGKYVVGELVRSFEYTNDTQYNMTISVQYGDSTNTQVSQFWTYVRGG
ncbi:hypothetical protein LCGC14_0372300 [marine sediment metagenome]|uniref:Uncharacterized protein n=1 Tax=marine sediment metagenome TaxID=412755 RepID=A0A0F9TAI9_9ZZZZ